MKYILRMAAALLFLAAACSVACGKGKHPKTAVRIASYNIRFLSPDDKGEFSWEGRKEANIAMMKDVSPDVIGFQEPMKGIYEYLIDNLSGYDSYIAWRDGRPGKYGRCQIIMWKKGRYELLDKGMFYLSDTPGSVSKSWDATHIRYTMYVKLRDIGTGAEFWFFNTHLDHRSQTARQNGVKLNVEMMKKIAGEDATVFIAGDMNISRRKDNGWYLDPYYEWMYSAVEMAPRTCDRPTFNGFGYEGKKPGWLDHIFYRNCKAMKFEVIDSEDYGVKYISDHYPIVGTFKF